jgi:heat-inducible transcriptional repressor
MMIGQLNLRSREIFRQLVEAYMATGQPVPSKLLADRLHDRGAGFSSPNIRLIMAQLEQLGLLYAPHTSAGRLPTSHGLRLFVDGLLEIGCLAEDERAQLASMDGHGGKSVGDMLADAGQQLAGLAACTSLVVAPSSQSTLRHLEFVRLSDQRALAVLVNSDGLVENRLLDLPAGLPSAALIEASNFINGRMIGKTIDEALADLRQSLAAEQLQLDQLTQQLVADGLAYFSDSGGDKRVVLHGQAQLLDHLAQVEELKSLFDALDSKETVIKLLELSGHAQGVQIYIGAENPLFAHTGCSMIVAPYSSADAKVIGAIGVIGPAHMNYARIIPMVDYTAKVVTAMFNNL